MIDEVEGASLQGKKDMIAYISKMPTNFPTINDAIKWT